MERVIQAPLHVAQLLGLSHNLILRQHTLQQTTWIKCLGFGRSQPHSPELGAAAPAKS